MTKSISIYNTCIYTYMHVCICTRTDVFVTMLECNVKSRLVALHLQRPQVRCTGSRCECTVSLSSTEQSSTSSVVIFKKRPTGLQSSSLSSLYWPLKVCCVIPLCFLRLIGWESQGGTAPPLNSVYFIGSSSFNHSSCAGYINSV